MNNSGAAGAESQGPAFFNTAIPTVSGLAAIVTTYFVAAADLGLVGVIIVTATGILFAAACAASNRPRRAPAANPGLEPESVAEENIFEEIEGRLVALDEANEVFGTSLNAADMFRLVASRIGEIFPLSAAGLAVPDETGTVLKFINFDGANADTFRGFEVPTSDGTAGRAFSTRRIRIENGLTSDIAAFGEKRLAGFTSAAAIPLLQDGEVFAVFQLFTEDRIGDGEDAVKLFAAIRDHVTPLFSNMLAFERSLSSALTDPLTGLPNERAFYMVLENQLAESLRHRDERPLTVLSIDIRDFGAVNSMLGHAVGDRMLEFAGQRIGESLRKMDFLARTVNDEFSVVLPTASEKIAFEVIERIRSGFERNEFEIANGECVSVALNVGWATFWKDGETADQLVRAAQQRKRQSKSEEPPAVLWFPKEYVN